MAIRPCCGCWMLLILKTNDINPTHKLKKNIEITQLICSWIRTESPSLRSPAILISTGRWSPSSTTWEWNLPTMKETSFHWEWNLPTMKETSFHTAATILRAAAARGSLFSGGSCDLCDRNYGRIMLHQYSQQRVTKGSQAATKRVSHSDSQSPTRNLWNWKVPDSNKDTLPCIYESLQEYDL